MHRGVLSAAIVGVVLVGTLAAPAQQSSTAPETKAQSITYVAPTKGNYLKFVGQAETMLHRDVLDPWFPRTVDNENGGFYASFSRDWKPGPSEGKFSVFQGRNGSSSRITRPTRNFTACTR